MTADVINFPRPSKRPSSFKILLYTDDEILITNIVVNSFAGLPQKVNNKTLSDVDPVKVLQCLEKALDSNLFSENTCDIIHNIIANIELNGPDSA